MTPFRRVGGIIFCGSVMSYIISCACKLLCGELYASRNTWSVDYFGIRMVQQLAIYLSRVYRQYGGEVLSYFTLCANPKAAH